MIGLTIETGLNAGSAVCALVAAIFWLLSASGRIPLPEACWDSTPETDPFVQSLQRSARLNRWAAGFAGAAAAFQAISGVIEVI